MTTEPRPGADASPTSDRLVAALGSVRDKMRKCYTQALGRDEKLHDSPLQLTIGFQVLPSGVVDAIEVRPAQDGALSSCLADVIRQLRFAPFSGQAVGVEVPLILRPIR